MSLDVYLRGPEEDVECRCKCGHVHTRKEAEEYFCYNITHNLNTMAEAAGIYKELWRPEEIGIFRAEQLVAPLTEGLKRLRKTPAKYKKLNPSNGWGSYEVLVNFVKNYLEACSKWPNATITASR